MKKNLISFVGGLLFALGVGFSGMTRPEKIIKFLNLYNWESWDYSLLIVMLVGMLVFFGVYQFSMSKQKPLLDSQFHLPTLKEITVPLVLGSLIFGIGWGVGGLCPGPAIVMLAKGNVDNIIFIISMSLGMLLQFIWSQRKV